jgi:hypothetical protein
MKLHITEREQTNDGIADLMAAGSICRNYSKRFLNLVKKVITTNNDRLLSDKRLTAQAISMFADFDLGKGTFLNQCVSLHS